MTAEADLREEICVLAKSIFDRGLTGGSTGNISAKTEDGGLLVTPTGTSFGRLDPNGLSRLATDGRLIDGDPPTKELPLHLAFHDTRPRTEAVVHLHSINAVAWSMLPEVDPENVLPPLTPYSIMQLGRVKLLPFFVPGDPAMGDAIRRLAGRYSAVLLANHGPIVAGESLEAAANAIEELEYTARLAMLVRALPVQPLTDDQVHSVVETLEVDR